VPKRPWILLALAIPSLARPAAYDVEARTEAQLYTLAARSPGSGRAVERRRLVEVLDLAGFELVPGEDAGLTLQLRLDADFAVADREEAGLDGVRRGRLQLLAGRLHWKGLLGGRLDLEAGRITAADPISFHRFDGGSATLRPWRWLAVGAFGGWRVTGTSWLGAAAFSPDGVREDDRRRLAAGTVASPCPGDPSRLCADPTLDDLAPTFGLRLALPRLPGAPTSGAEVEYRRTLRAGQVIEERLSGGARWRRGGWGADAGAEWDLFVRRLTALRAGVRAEPLGWLALALEGLHAHPTFSADAIWSFFATAPSQEGRLRADAAPAGWPVRLWLAGGVRRYGEAPLEVPVALPSSAGWEPFGAAGVAGALGAAELAADGSLRGGPEGTLFLAAAAARLRAAGWIGIEGRASFAHVEDRVVRKNGGDFPSLGLLLSGRLERRAQLAFLVEGSAPRWERTDLRAFASLTLGADWDTRLPR